MTVQLSIGEEITMEKKGLAVLEEAVADAKKYREDSWQHWTGIIKIRQKALNKAKRELKKLEARQK